MVECIFANSCDEEEVESNNGEDAEETLNSIKVHPNFMQQSQVLRYCYSAIESHDLHKCMGVMKGKIQLQLQII